MGTLYSVLPLNQKSSEWLDTEGVTHPPPSETARYPTPREIAEELRRLPGATVSINSDVQTKEWTAHVEITGVEWVGIRVRDFCSEDVPHEFYFPKGSPELVFAITERLARRCGTLVIVDDSTCRPIVVPAGSDPKELFRQYVTVSLDIWWAVPGVLAGMSMPFIHPQRHDTPGAALEAFPDELPALWHAGIRGVVCLLNMPGAANTYAAAGFTFHLLPLADGTAPTAAEFQQFLDFVAGQRALGHPVAVHCEAGIGRTGTLLAGFLIANGFTPDASVSHVRSLRRGAVETSRQLQFLHDTYSVINQSA